MSKLSNSIVALDKFILSTRDSGYKSTSSAVAELIDNALQAGAKNIRISIEASDAMSGSDVRIQIADDGIGMDRHTLIQAMRFGGSGRYNDRSSLGRFGMGLPNASLGQARRVSVYTWQSTASVLTTYLDVDEIAAGSVDSIPEPVRHKAVADIDRIDTRNGTTVVWERCDRLDNRRPSTLARKLTIALGRIFRYFLFKGVSIEINGTQVKPIDPLYLNTGSVQSGARQFQSTWTCEVYADPAADDRPTRFRDRAGRGCNCSEPSAAVFAGLAKVPRISFRLDSSRHGVPCHLANCTAQKGHGPIDLK